jgi:hypothetical protein
MDSRKSPWWLLPLLIAAIALLLAAAWYFPAYDVSPGAGRF